MATVRNFVAQPPFRWALLGVYTVLSVIFMLQPGQQPVIGPAMPPGEPTFTREAIFVTGHIVLFAGFAAVWWWALYDVVGHVNALVIGVVTAIAVGTGGEFLQALSPDRFPSPQDFIANAVGAVVGAAVVHRWFAPKAEPPTQ